MMVDPKKSFMEDSEKTALGSKDMKEFYKLIFIVGQITAEFFYFLVSKKRDASQDIYLQPPKGLTAEQFLNILTRAKPPLQPQS